MNRILTLGTAAAMLCASANAVLASDARAVALGGSVIANGTGVHGAVSNPAALMAMQRRGETIHVRAGFNVEIRDTGEFIETLTDEENENLINDVDNEIEALSNSTVTCNLGSSEDTACVNGTQPLSDLASRFLDIIDKVDEESIEAYGASDFGMANTRHAIPFAINLRFSAAGFGSPDISDDDREYISDISTLLDGDTVTFGDVAASDFLEITFDAQAGTLIIDAPEETLKTTGRGGVLFRTQLSVSLARTFAVAGHKVDFGVIPKFSSLEASSVEFTLDEEFNEETESASDRFFDNEVNDNSFTADVGASTMLPNAPVQVAAVIRNLIPESITTKDGFEFETTPQLIIGGSYQRDKFTFNGDIALNSAKQDNFETQKMGVGVEFGTGRKAIRAGINHDAARTQDSTALSLGFTFGPLVIGGRISDLESAEFGGQLAYSFK